MPRDQTLYASVTAGLSWSHNTPSHGLHPSPPPKSGYMSLGTATGSLETIALVQTEKIGKVLL
jgi:hypothetical protein